MLDQLTLMPYADRQARTFSGGMKRKLSLGIALIGNPRIIFLDEPTTGVDPESRRFVWTLISNTLRRSSPSVILTTHSMDECEALCSRIGIMVNGQLVCLGSAPHLKAVHGYGFQFEVTFNAEANLKNANLRLRAFLAQRFGRNEDAHVGRAHLRCEEGNVDENADPCDFQQRVKCRLPKGMLPISEMFREVEAHRTELNISEYSISETTLEQIFIHFARRQIDEETGAAMGMSTTTHGASHSLEPATSSQPPDSSASKLRRD